MTSSDAARASSNTTGDSDPVSINDLPVDQYHRSADILSAAFCRVRASTDELTKPLGPEDQMIQSMPEASPAKWHRAHSSWFFETFILQAFEQDFHWHDRGYCYLFNSYYYQVGKQYARPRRGLISRPDSDQVQRYRERINHRMLTLLATADPGRLREFAPLLILGLNHEQQHQELLLTDIKHGLFQNPAFPAYQEGKLPESLQREHGWLEFEGGLAEIGYAGTGFCFDNECPAHPVMLAPFSIATQTVSVAQYLEFMADGGYQNPVLWLSDGWAWRQEQSIECPLYWHLDADQWRQFTLLGDQVLNPAAPVVHVSYYEADAFCRWAGARLPTEFEWERAVGGDHDWARQHSPALHPAMIWPDSGGLATGNAWEWTSSAYAAYPGFTPGAGSIGEYNGKFMANQMVLKGGSCATAYGHSRPSYRNFFYPDARWQFSTLRLARDG